MASEPYDIKLTISGGSSYGFMLASPEGQSKALILDELQGQDAQTGARTDYDARFDTPWAQSDFSGGVGDLEYNPEGNTCWWAKGVVLHIPGKVFPAQDNYSLSFTSGADDWDGSCSFLTSGGTRYDFMWQNTRLYRRDASNATNTWTLVYTAGSAITHCAIVGGAMLICTPSDAGTTDFFHQPDPTAAATWTPATRNHTAFSAALGKPKYMVNVRGTTYAVVDPNKVFYTTDVTTDSWVGPINTSLSGNTSGPPGGLDGVFTGAVAVNDFLFVFNRAAGYNIDATQEVTEVLWQWKDKPSTAQFAYTAVGGETLYYSIANEVWAYDPNTGRNISLGLSMKSGFSMKAVHGIGADTRYVYVLAQVRVPTIRSADSVALLRGWKTSASTWAFEVLWEDTSNPTSYKGIFVSPYGQGSRVYWFTTSGTTSYHIDVPAEWDESTSTYMPSSSILYTSLWRTPWPTFQKRWLWLATQTSGLTGSAALAITYTTNDGVSETALGTLTSPGLTFSNFGANSGSPGIGLRFTFGASGSDFAILRSFELHSRVRWRYLPAVQATIRIADSLELQQGARDYGRTAAQIMTDLNTLRTSNSTILYEDWLGNSFNVSVEKVQLRPTRWERPERNGAGLYELEAVIAMARADSGS